MLQSLISSNNLLMEFSDVVKNRVSCRSYNGKAVSQEMIDKILEEMVLAPTAGHLQAYRVKVLMADKLGEREAIERIGELAGQKDRVKGCGAMMVFFAVPSDAAKYGERGETLFALQDATIACAYAQLKACDLGLASLWVGAFDEGEVRKVCGKGGVGEVSEVEGGSGSDERLSGTVDEIVPISVLVLGYTDEKLERSGRKDLKNLLI